jgi:hypothetical protein
VDSRDGRLRDELLLPETFETLAEAKYLVDQWRLHCNRRRPQRALGKVSPAAYAANFLRHLRVSSLALRAAAQRAPIYHAATLKRGGPMRAAVSRGAASSRSNSGSNGVALAGGWPEK